MPTYNRVKFNFAIDSSLLTNPALAVPTAQETTRLAQLNGVAAQSALTPQEQAAFDRSSAKVATAAQVQAQIDIINQRIAGRAYAAGWQIVDDNGNQSGLFDVNGVALNPTPPYSFDIVQVGAPKPAWG